MMQGYSDQKYNLTKSKYDNKNQVTLINMEIFDIKDDSKIYWKN